MSSAEVVLVVVVARGASTEAVAKETGNSWFGFGLEPKLRLMLESCMHLVLLGSLGENLGVEKAFKVVLEVEIRGGEAKTFNGDEVFMFRDKRDQEKWKARGRRR